MSDLRLLAISPWVGALLVLVAPARFARGLAVAVAVAVAVALAAAIEGDAGMLEVPWLARGIGLRLAIGPLGLVGLVCVAASAVRATCVERGRGRLAGILALHGAGLLGLLAQDVVALAAVWTLVPVLTLVLLAGSGEPRGRRAGRTLALGLSLAAAALLLAAAGAMVALHGASSGTWSAALAELTTVRSTVPMSIGLAVASGAAGALALGLWPLHAGMVEGAERGIGAPIRWLGLDALVRLWVPLTPVGAAACAPVLAALSVCGAIYAGLVAGAERDPGRRAGQLALVPWSLAALGVSTLAHEGCVGALVLGAVGSLGADAGRSGPLARAGVGLVAVFGGGLVAIAALRFSDLTLGALGPWAALGAVVALWLAGVVLVSGDRFLTTGDRGPVPTTMERVTAGLAAMLLVALVARPALVARAVAAGEAWVDDAARIRCLSLEAPRIVPVRVSATPEERCEAALQGLRLGLARERERGAREALAGGEGASR